MNNGIMVNPAELSNFGNFLIKSANKVYQDLGEINNTMQTLGNAWSDQVGAEYATKFAGFVSQSTDICQALNDIGKNVNIKANNYAQIIANALNRMG